MTTAMSNNSHSHSKNKNKGNKNKNLSLSKNSRNKTNTKTNFKAQNSTNSPIKHIKLYLILYENYNYTLI